jgi:hypothetical protein
MKKGLLYFHQGMTDIMNCLSLINLYATRYSEITVIMRTDSKELFNYYITDKPGVSGVFYDLTDLTYNFEKILKSYSSAEYDYLFHGHLDYHRLAGDPYREAFGRAYDPHRDHFIKLFYTAYDISYMSRIEYFSFKRDHDLENKIYEEFIFKHGSNYAIYHDNPTPGISHREISFSKQEDIPYVNLNLCTANMFEMLKVIEQSTGDIHVIDSVWCSLCLLLDCKTNFLSNRQIYIHPFLSDFRSGGCLLDRRDTGIKPVHPSNWRIVPC